MWLDGREYTPAVRRLVLDDLVLAATADGDDTGADDAVMPYSIRHRLIIIVGAE